MFYPYPGYFPRMVQTMRPSRYSVHEQNVPSHLCVFTCVCAVHIGAVESQGQRLTLSVVSQTSSSVVYLFGQLVGWFCFRTGHWDLGRTESAKPAGQWVQGSACLRFSNTDRVQVCVIVPVFSRRCWNLNSGPHVGEAGIWLTELSNHEPFAFCTKYVWILSCCNLWTHIPALQTV